MAPLAYGVRSLRTGFQYDGFKPALQHVGRRR